jgi:hypothetical protein
MKSYQLRFTIAITIVLIQIDDKANEYDADKNSTAFTAAQNFGKDEEDGSNHENNIMTLAKKLLLPEQ